MEPIGIRPTVDFVFKALFGSPDHLRITIHFLNSILDQQVRINQVLLRNPIQDKETEDDKLSILDIVAIDEQGRTFIIEMQTSLPAGLGQRLTYYTAWEYVDQLSEGDNYSLLRPTISICVMTRPMFPLVSELHLDFRLRDESGLVMTNDLQVHLLQLSNLTVIADNVKGASPIEQWAFFLKNGENLTMNDIPRLFIDEVFREAGGVLETISRTPEQRRHYEARLKFERDEAARLEQARNEGIELGIEKGKERGSLLGQISILQELLTITTPTAAELSNFDLNRLSEIREQLHEQLKNRHP